ncbi:transaminase prephenate dehydratase 1-aminocyclopropane-1-carboxylate synthase activity [Phytophthora sojae]|uniref:Transaminase prephenate dehydratase 1-aminocyclopropane-1-carboxylate synthase activity n=1 Tax=Phytophthora sojae (strain P6497) TaxID=1094619 RepID=G4ZJ32_PHYSP|nr:transaminase prephenate dehydratase 1-aminocyclopropane-1-carboxylate synthase activity [Phytophthora sojae]EGZ17279.1 transaminase prephenate dehydratase 1-aminocyclopropane-1-carboxylate synthase activity [Phytophthora sojae]|eukprot:XP_009526337.1 transaminase prephenate dehydratase 1-aminocyclopropane-1-carboxylate synthase activity [Phytophthora sojae]
MAVGPSTRVAYHEDAAFPGAKDAAAQMLSTVDQSKAISYATLEDAVVAVKKDDAQFAVLPVDSATCGSCYESYDLLIKYNLAVVGEYEHSAKTSDAHRFWMVAKTPVEPSPKTDQCKTSLAFAFASGNAHGQLHRALGLFASREIDLSKIESRPWSSAHPSAGKAEFIFYADLKARQSDAKAVEAIAALRAMCSYVCVLGCYSSGAVETTNGAPDAVPQELTMAQKYPLSPVFDNTTIAKTIAIFGVTKEMEASGKLVHSLCVGEPDFPPPKVAMDAGIRALQQGQTKYCDMRGMAGLREIILLAMYPNFKIIVEYLQRTKGVKYDPDTEIQICSGAQQALYNAMLAICRPRDKILLPSPYWGNYEGCITQVKAGLVRLRNKLEEDYLINPTELEKTLTANTKTKMMILCNPSNPAGTLHSPEHLEKIAAVLRKPQFQHVVVISDEIYEQLAFQDEGAAERKHVSFAALPGMHERTILINGFSKAFAMTGLRVGYMAGPKHFIEPCQLMQGQTTSCANSVGQIMAIEAMKLELETIERGEVRIAEDLHDLDLKRQYIVKRLRAIPSMRFAYPTAAFYVFMDLALYFEGKKAYTTGKSEVLDNVNDFFEYLIPVWTPNSYAGPMDTMVHAMDGLEFALNALTFE